MKKFVNFRFVVTLVLAVFANVATYAQDNVVDEVVWVVGDEAILKSDVEEARMDALYNGRRFEGDPYCVIPEEIAVQKLFLHQAKLDSIEVSEAEIIQRVDMMTNMYIQQIGSREKMEEYFNKTSTQIRETLRDNARDGLTVQKMQQKLAGDIKVTPAEVFIQLVSSTPSFYPNLSAYSQSSWRPLWQKHLSDSLHIVSRNSRRVPPGISGSRYLA